MPTILQTLSKCKKLVKAECCNFDNSCLINGRTCIFHCPFDGDDVLIRCLYFEQCVLPINPTLEFTYNTQRKIKNKKGLSKCDCGKLFVSDSNAQKYCSEECQKKARKKTQREWAKNKRSASTNRDMKTP
jgi:hypothetical protein